MVELNLAKLGEHDKRFAAITTSEAKAVDKINDALMWGAMNYLRKEGFTWVGLPEITKITGACENVDTLYKLDHFGQEAYLAQTGQLYLEAKVPLLEKVWTTIVSSRAESDVDTRHLNQFHLLELEHQGNLEQLLGYIEGTIKSMFCETITKTPHILDMLGRYSQIQQWTEQDFGKMTYTQGIEILQKSKRFNNVEWGIDLNSTMEKYLVEENGHKPLFITHYPTAIKFFNMKQNETDPSIVNSTDLILPYAGESVGAAERENNYDTLLTRLATSSMFQILSSRGKTLAEFGDYLEIVRNHPVLHSGCGIGFNRVTQSVLGVADIKIGTPFPIQKGHLY